MAVGDGGRKTERVYIIVGGGGGWAPGRGAYLYCN